MRSAVFFILALALATRTGGASDAAQPVLELRSEGTETERAEYAALSMGLGVGRLSFGRPRSALDDVAFSGPGLSVAQSRSRAGEAARKDLLGPGILLKSAPYLGFSLSTSVHEGQAEDSRFVALSGQYVTPEIEPIGTIAVYGGAEGADTVDVYRLGTSLTRGIAQAGLDFTTEDGLSQRRITGIYLGLDLTEQFSMAVSREVERDRDGEVLPPRLGVGAAFDIGERHVISGAIGDMTGETPTFGVMLGLEF